MLYPQAMPIQVLVLQDRDVVITQTFPEEKFAISWADVYGEALRQQGWHDEPTPS